MLSLLPDFADPLRLCALGKLYQGETPLEDLRRLVPLLVDADGVAAFALAFDTDGDGRPIIDVSVKATLALECQRCLQTLRLDVDSVSRLAVVSGLLEAERLPEGLDPLLVDDGRLELRSLIEDELILSIPPAPAHAPDDCAVSLDGWQDEPETSHTADDAGGPFAELANWKSDSNEQN